MKDKVFYLKIIILLLIVINAFSFTKVSKCENNNNLCYYDNNYVLIEKNKIANKYTSYLYKDSYDNFVSKIYDDDNKEISINDLIKEDKVDSYNKKIAELIYQKYPKFIADILIQDNVVKSYVIRENELVIYFNDYEIIPKIDELLYLKVNYNEIKDYLSFTVILDNNYEIEDGYNYTNSKKSVAITFDDSPNGSKTTRLLEILNNNKAHATFFVVGEKIKNNKDILISMKRLGNEIGSHTYSHKSMNKMTNEEIIDDYNKMNEIYKNIFNEDISLIRPPYGAYKNKMLNLTNTSFIMWSLDTNDWRYKNENYLIDYVVENIKDGDIILFHDSYNSTINTIEELLPILYSKGYQVMSVSELFELKGKNLELNKVYFNAY